MIATLALSFVLAQDAPIQVCDNVITQVSLSPDGKLAGVASNNRKAYIVDLATGKTLATLGSHSSVVNDIVFSPDGKRVATASTDKTVKIWSLEGAELKSYAHQDAWALSATWSPDGKTLACSYSDNEIHYLDGNSYAMTKKLDSRLGAPKLVRYNPAGTLMLAVGGTSRSGVAYLDPAGKTLHNSANDFRGDMEFANFSKDGKYILGSSSGNPPHLVLLDGKTFAKIHDFESICVDGYIPADNSRCIVLGGDGDLRIFNIATKARDYKGFPRPGDMQTREQMALTPDETTCIVGGMITGGKWGLMKVPVADLK